MESFSDSRDWQSRERVAQRATRSRSRDPRELLRPEIAAGAASTDSAARADRVADPRWRDALEEYFCARDWERRSEPDIESTRHGRLSIDFQRTESRWLG